jgi:hypothetical protein
MYAAIIVADPSSLYELKVLAAETPVKLASPQVFNEQGEKVASPR